MNDTKLKDLNIDLEELCCFLIPLFYETNRKYSCSRTKIGKLLSILAFKYAVNGEKLFNETIYKYEDCGTAIEGIMFLLERDEYFCSPYEDDKRYIIEGLKATLDLPKRWQKLPDIPTGVMMNTLEVFRTFGAYSQTDLDEVLNPIVDKLTNVSYGEINLSKLDLVIDDMNQNNEVIKYLKLPRLDRETINTKNVKRKIKK